MFDKIFAFTDGKKSVGKDKGTEWMQELNEIRNGIAHVTSGRQVSMEELALIARYHDWVKEKVENPDADIDDQASDEHTVKA